MRVGFISDIHGNLLALDAVLADLEQQRARPLVCLGDICFGPQAHECLERVRELGCPVILGNWDSLVDRRLPAGRRPGRDHALRDRPLVGRPAHRRRPRVRAHVRPRRSTSRSRTARGCSASTARRARSRTGSSRRPPTTTSRTMFAGARRRRARRRPHAPADAAPLRPSMIVNPGSVGQPFSQWWPREIRVAHWAEYGVIDIERRRASRSTCGACRTTSTAAAAAAPRATCPTARWWIDSWNAC